MKGRDTCERKDAMLVSEKTSGVSEKTCHKVKLSTHGLYIDRSVKKIRETAIPYENWRLPWAFAVMQATSPGMFFPTAMRSWSPS